MSTLFQATGLNAFDEVADDDFFYEDKKPGKNFFDAVSLPDTPSRSFNAVGAEVFVLHLAFDTQEDLLRAIRALSVGTRKSLIKTSKEATFNGIALRPDGSETWLDFWERKLAETKPIVIKKKKKSKDDDEAQEPFTGG